MTKHVAFALSLCLLILVAVLLVLWRSLAAWEAHIVVTNRASEAVVRGQIIAFGKKYSLAQIPVGGTDRVVVQISGEGGIQAQVTFGSGRRLSSGPIGYLTPGANIDVEMPIEDDSIGFSFLGRRD